MEGGEGREDELDLPEVFEDAVAAVEHDVGDEFEAVLSAVVRIGDFGVGEVGAKGHERLDFGAVGIVAGEAEDVAAVVFVHGKDEVEVVKVRLGKLAGRAGDADVAVAQGGRHAGIRAFADVVASGASGIE